MTAPDSVVAAVQVALGCVRGDASGRCQRHARAWHPAYPCPTAQEAADAAWAAAYPAALRDAAGRLGQRRWHTTGHRPVVSVMADDAETLRRWADESEEP